MTIGESRERSLRHRTIGSETPEPAWAQPGAFEPARAPHRDRGSRAAALLVLAGAVTVAVVSARGYAGSWNDGSRLAGVESLVDRHTFIIDDSIFVRVPAHDDPAALPPYPADDPLLLQRGTSDKLFIDGHFYSDKPPVPAVLMAGLYQVLQWFSGQTARGRPDRFCYWMTVGTSGLAYVLAVWCIFQLGTSLSLPLASRLLLTASFALATVAPAYTRHVNGHILLLAVAAALLLALARLAQTAWDTRPSWPSLMWLGTLAGVGYSIDLGAGPLLLLCTLVLVVYRCRSVTAVAALALAALPWLIAHHALNYSIGGTLIPANAVVEYLQWPDSPFTAGNVTGVWHHRGGQLLTYGIALLVGRRGFLGHNLALFLAVVAYVPLLRRRVAEAPEVVSAGVWCAATWALYALASTNYSGECASIRWFVPLLAPAYFVLAVLLREYRGYRSDFLVLSAWGCIVAGFTWWYGPWVKHAVPFYWRLQIGALASWLACRRWRRRRYASDVG